MSESTELEQILESAHVNPEVFALRPDYRAVLVAVDGLIPGPSDKASDHLLQTAEAAAANLLASDPVEDLPHIAAWRDAYRGFGAKPQRTRNSLEALVRRAGTGLPRVNRLTDLYNAVSILHQVPLGGEDLAGYVGSPQLIRAVGNEPFDTTSGGAEIIEHPEPGEVVWRDSAGVTCRRWNWRQGRRTQLSDHTTTALFILDALDPLTDEALGYAVDDLGTELQHLNPDLSIVTRRIGAKP